MTQHYLAVLLLFVACGGVSSRDGGTSNGDSSGSGARNGSGSGANGSVGSGPIPGGGGFGNSAGIGGTSSRGGDGNVYSPNGPACVDACSNSLYNDCIADPTCENCMQQTSSSGCNANENFVAFTAYACTCLGWLGCYNCFYNPSGAGGEGGNDGYGGEPVSAGYGGELIAAGAPGGGD